MKRALPYKTLILFLILPLLATASSTEAKGKYTKKKTINKEYSVASNASLSVDNSYGNIDIITWNENRVVFEITITTTGNDEEKVQEKLDDITIHFEASSSNISAETRFGERRSNSWWNWTRNNKVNMKINYIVKIPITNNIDLNNDYGSINVDKLEGHAEINCDYGKITTKELMSDNNSINFDYTKNCYFEYIKSGKINADYSGFTVSKANKLDINADYTNSKIEIAEDVNYNCDYGNISIDKANNIIGNGDYLTTIIGDVYKNIIIKADYGSIKIKRMNENAGSVTIKSDYVGIKIGYVPAYHFNFNIDLEYGSLNTDGLEFTKKIIESTDKLYIGYYGSKNSSNTINIESEYGSVSLYKN
ncbi:hypothetical protein [Flavivirga rizhaonensis]|uniref:Adhesin domain-containing protein n=1 Tax=Flavivirga rizhaonensis TaxID=2559571 RepID=A0A4V3P4Z6_9FLAO|nr:hypothetical protein [Flavivirga rizhaonensis]TGV03324.1 hypothetical protein EM932_06510 [Flavivirga rizhaonensis]